MDAQILFVFKVGHSVYRRPNPTPHKTHHWRCTVESWSDQYPLSNFVNNVVFQLHETFKNPRQVVTKEPFSIEEDGFGNFRLHAMVSFLNVITDLHYDITLHDNRELYAFRTVRLEPKNCDEWIRYTQYGGIPIPKSANSYDIQQTVVEPIQSSGANCNLPISHFYPELAAAILGQASTSSSFKYGSPNSLRCRPNRECRNQALANLGLPLTNVSPALTIAASASMAAASGRYLPSLMSSSFKHKKKLQLKHEAQLRLENLNQAELTSSPPSGLSRPPPTTSSWPASTTACSQVVQQPDRIVLRLFRSDIVEKRKSKSKKKHKHHHHRGRRQNETGDENVAQQQPLANRLEWSSSRSPSGDVTSYNQSPHTSLDRGEENSRCLPSSFSISSRIEGAPPLPLETGTEISKISSGIGNQKAMESTEISGFPQMDSQHATLIWLSQLKGGPQPLVSPLPPSHASLGLTSTSPLPSQKSQGTLEQKEPKSQRTKDLERYRRSKDANCTSKIGEFFSTSSSRRETARRSVDEEMGEGSRGLDAIQASTTKFVLSPDSTPPMSVEAALVPESILSGRQTSKDKSVMTAADSNFDNEELERLFDRLLGLRHESMALRLAEILRRYSKPDDPNFGVNEIDLPESYPSVIAFDLRKVPLACLLEMADVVLTDEQITASSS